MKEHLQSGAAVDHGRFKKVARGIVHERFDDDNGVGNPQRGIG